MNKFFWNGFCFVAIIVALIIYACANRGYPQGGEKDVTPPQVIKEVPESFSTNFKGKQIDIYFDEYVQLKDINKKFVMSPPMKKKARVSLRGKYVRVTFQDSLKPNTTYTLDFADAIVDNNEGNPLGFYRYVFSTGPQLDSMELGGQVIDMQTQLPVLGATVMFYQNTADSVPLTDLPSYVAKTDSAGMFRVTNIKDDTYRVMAIDDARGNYLFVPSETKVGFIDSLIPVSYTQRLSRDGERRREWSSKWCQKTRLFGVISPCLGRQTYLSRCLTRKRLNCIWLMRLVRNESDWILLSVFRLNIS